MLKLIKKIIFNKIIKIKLIEAMAWTRKYFNEASEEIILFELEMRGINLKRLISNPIQHPIQELAEIEIKVLNIRMKIKNILFELKKKLI